MSAARPRLLPPELRVLQDECEGRHRAAAAARHHQHPPDRLHPLRCESTVDHSDDSTIDFYSAVMMFSNHSLHFIESQSLFIFFCI